MTPLQTLSVSGGSGISIQRTSSVPIQCARGSLGDNKLSHPVFLCGDSRCLVGFPREEHLFPKEEGRRLRIISSSINPTF
jgi:hypothetical protein